MTQNSSAFLLFPRNTTSTRLTLRTEGMKVYCGVNKLISSNTASQQRNVSSAVLCWSKVAWNTIRGESSFRTTANHFPWADFESCCLFFFFFLNILVFLPSRFGFDWNWLFLELDSNRTSGFAPASAWPWVIGASESKSRAVQTSLLSSCSQQLREHNLGWVSIREGALHPSCPGGQRGTA